MNRRRLVLLALSAVSALALFAIVVGSSLGIGGITATTQAAVLEPSHTMATTTTDGSALVADYYGESCDVK